MDEAKNEHERESDQPESHTLVKGEQLDQEGDIDITNGERDETHLLCSVCSKWIPRGTLNVTSMKKHN